MSLAAVAAVAFPASAAAMPADGGGMDSVSIVGTTFAPGQIEALVGDTVTWSNESVLHHTVTSTDGRFSSPQIFAGETWSHRFDAPGVEDYYCAVHPFMQGEVDVHTVLLDTPHEPGAPGRAYTLTGRAALPEGATVTIERDDGSGFAPVGQAAVGVDGAFLASVRSASSASYRAVGGGDTSPPVTVLVEDRTVHASAHGRVVRAQVTPASPHATVVLQLHLRNRFGWWPQVTRRLDRHSRVRFVAPRLPHPVRARVVLTLSDGATQLARSAVLKVR